VLEILIHAALTSAYDFGLVHFEIFGEFLSQVVGSVLFLPRISRSRGVDRKGGDVMQIIEFLLNRLFLRLNSRSSCLLLLVLLFSSSSPASNFSQFFQGSSGGKSPVIQEFTTVGTTSWTVPSGVRYIKVFIVGGGGGGTTSPVEDMRFEISTTGGFSGLTTYTGSSPVTAGQGHAGGASLSYAPNSSGIVYSRVYCASGGAGLDGKGGGGGGGCYANGATGGGKGRDGGGNGSVGSANGGDALANTGGGGGGGGYNGRGGNGGSGYIRIEYFQ
jgi:hypothetical protein